MEARTLHAPLDALSAANRPQGIEIATLTTFDIPALAALSLEAYGDDVTPEALLETSEELRLTFEGAFGATTEDSFIGAWDGGTLVGAILVVRESPWDDAPDCPFVVDLIVAPEWESTRLLLPEHPTRPAAVFLGEYSGGWIARAITFLVDVMTGIPSIVAGLFAYSIFLIAAGPRYQAGIIGAVALSVLMTPVVIRGVEEMLKLVPSHLREASYALGVPKWLTIVKVVLRTAVAGITTSVMIAIARVIGETAPLLITVGLTIRTNTNPLDGSMSTLPVLVYDQYSRGEAAAMERAWAGALTLIILVMLLNLAARLISKYFSPTGGRPRWRSCRATCRDGIRTLFRIRERA